MFIRFSKLKVKDRTYEYAQICENVRVGKRIRRRVLGNLGRRDQLEAKDLDSLIQSLRRFASPEVQAYRPLGELEIEDAKSFGGSLAVWQLWQMAGLDSFFEAREGRHGPLQEAVFRLVTSRLLEPQSKLATTEWQDTVHWPSPGPRPEYKELLAAMDALLPLKAELEEHLFLRFTQDLFNLPLRYVLYDVSSSYFEGDGACELAEFGYSRDHRSDRRQIVYGLAITPEGLPITQRVYPGSTGDTATFLDAAADLKDRFGLNRAMIVADQGMFSADNIAALEEAEQPYVLAIRARSMKAGKAAVAAAEKAGLTRPKDREAPWQVREVDLGDNRRHVVVFSAFKADHDRIVRRTRLQKTRDDLKALARQALRNKLKRDDVITRATRIFAERGTGQYFGYLAGNGGLSFWIERSAIRQQRRLDGIFILQTNQPSNLISTDEVVAAYRQLSEIERAFRLVKSLIRVRPVFHWLASRVEAHLFVCYLAFALAKVLELRLADLSADDRQELGGAPDRKLTAARALTHLASFKAVQHRWQDWEAVQATKPTSAVVKIFAQLGLAQLPKLISLRQFVAP